MKATRGPLLSYGDGEKLKRCFVLKIVLPGVAPRDSFYIITDESSQKLSPAKKRASDKVWDEESSIHRRAEEEENPCWRKTNERKKENGKN